MCSDNPELPPEANKAKCFVIAPFVFSIFSMIGFLGGIPGVIAAIAGINFRSTLHPPLVSGRGRRIEVRLSAARSATNSVL